MDEEIRERRLRRRRRLRKARFTQDLLDRVNDSNDLLEPELEEQTSPSLRSSLDEEAAEDEARSLDE